MAELSKNTRYKTMQASHLSGQRAKLPPQAVDLEEAVLGALMIEKEALLQVEDILMPESFYKPQHQEIYKAILHLSSDSEPIDMLTVTQQLRKQGQLEIAGGASYLMKLTSFVNSAANIEAHARIIAQLAIKRELISISDNVQKEAYEDTSDAFDLLDAAEQQLFELSEGNIAKNSMDIRSAMQEALSDLENKKDIQNGLTGIPTGFSALDRITAGWQKSDLIIIAARPGMGKTAFSLSMIRNAAIDFGHPVAIFSLEMSVLQLTNRLISAEAELASDKIKRGMLANHEWQQLYTRVARLTESKIFIDDTPAISIMELRAKVRRLKAQHDIQLLIIDYLQLMSGSTSNKMTVGNREQEIALISRSLKNLAKEVNIPIIALSQLSRAVETRGGDKRPQLSDLRESGSIEQDADMVLFLYRPEYYGITQDAEGNPTTGIGELMIAKHRNGSLGDVKLRFEGKFTKFLNLEDDAFMQANFANGPQGATMTLSSKINDPNNFKEEEEKPNNDTGSFGTTLNPNDEPPF